MRTYEDAYPHLTTILSCQAGLETNKLCDWITAGTTSAAACRHAPALQPTVGGLAGFYDSAPSSPNIRSGATMAGERALPVRPPPNISQHCAADRKHISAQPVSAIRSEQHHRSLAFSVPAFPMPEHHGSCATLSQVSQAAAAALNKTTAATSHDRASPNRRQGGPEQQGLPKAATKSATMKGNTPGSKVHMEKASPQHAAASGRGKPASQAGLHDFTGKLKLRSTADRA